MGVPYPGAPCSQRPGAMRGTVQGEGFIGGREARSRRWGTPVTHLREEGSYPKGYRKFIELFNEERFWDAHEALEGLWRKTRSPFYQGIIIYASAFVHVQRGNSVGVGKQMAKVLRYLPPYEPGYMGLDVTGILARAREAGERTAGREDLRGQREALERLVPFPRLRLEPRFLRGDEPELLVGEEDGL